jgi:hypothetical protein
MPRYSRQADYFQFTPNPSGNSSDPPLIARLVVFGDTYALANAVSGGSPFKQYQAPAAEVDDQLTIE